MDMICAMQGRKGAEVLIDYCARRLAPARAAEFEKHLENCPDCRRAVNAQREVWNAMDGCTSIEVSPDFDARLYARIAEEEAAPAWRKWTRRVLTPAVPVAIWKPAVPLAAACAALVFTFVIRTPEPRETAKQLRAEHVLDIEQVERTLADLDMLTPSGSM
jgi:anti-sigma factor RsiW